MTLTEYALVALAVLALAAWKHGGEDHKTH